MGTPRGAGEQLLVVVSGWSLLLLTALLLLALGGGGVLGLVVGRERRSWPLRAVGWALLGLLGALLLLWLLLGVAAIRLG